MSIEAALGESGQPAEYLPSLCGKLIDVHVDAQNPLRSYITVEADKSNNNGIYSGTFNVVMNDELTPAERMHSANVAEEKGSGITGAIINEKMKRRIGRTVVLENYKPISDGTGSCRWVDFHSTDVYRRSGLVHTYAVADAKQPGGPRFPRITHLTVIRHAAFDVEDVDAMERMKKVADSHFLEATRPSNYTVPQNPADPNGIQLNHLRSSMPRSAFAFVIVNKDSREVLQYSNFLYQRSKFKDSDIPGHLTPEDAMAFKGRFPSLPYNGESLQLALNKVKSYAEKKYAGTGITPQILCVEGVRYAVTKKSTSRDILAQNDESQIRKLGQKLSPIEMIHLANETQYPSSSLPGEESTSPIKKSAYVKDVVFSFAPNRGDTFSRYINCKTKYPMVDSPWITQITLDDQPLNVPEKLKAPIAGAISNIVRNTPQQSAPAADQQQPTAVTPPAESEHSVEQEPSQQAAAAQPPAEPPSTQEAPAKEANSLDKAVPENASATPPAPTTDTSAATETEPTPEPAVEPSAATPNPDADLYHGPGNLMFS